MIHRRSFLASILASGVAPAIVRVENIARIWTPAKIFLPPSFSEIVREALRKHGPLIQQSMQKKNPLYYRLIEEHRRHV